MAGKITFDQFSAVEIRIGRVTEAVVPEWSHWVIKLTVNFGEEVGVRTIFAGMMKFFKPDEFVGKQFPFVVNIEPKKIGPNGDFSEGMMLAADFVQDETDPESGRPVLFSLGEEVPDGTKIR